MLLLFPALYIAYKHGKTGKMCWPILVTFFLFRIIPDAYYLAGRDKPDVPTTVAMMTSSACTATLSLTIIGLIYEAYAHPTSLLAQHICPELTSCKFDPASISIQAME